jgi:hypothetical protein
VRRRPDLSSSSSSSASSSSSSKSSTSSLSSGYGQARVSRHRGHTRTSTHGSTAVPSPYTANTANTANNVPSLRAPGGGRRRQRGRSAAASDQSVTVHGTSFRGRRKKDTYNLY